MKYLFSLIVFLFSWHVNAQENSLLERMRRNVSDSCLTLQYTYTARVSGIDQNASGTLVNQGEKWVVTGNGVEMYCDGTTVWVVDRAHKEVVIEPIDDASEVEFLTNPARAAINMHDSFNVNTINPSSDGKALIYSLSPRKTGKVVYLNIELTKDTASIRNISFALSDGTLVKIKVSSMKLTPKVSDEAFVPHTVFDSQWIVTDLR